MGPGPGTWQRSGGGRFLSDAPRPERPTGLLSSDYRGQLSDIRRAAAQRWMGNRGVRTRTIADLPSAAEVSRAPDAKRRREGGIHTFDDTVLDPEAIGREALRQTNAFRATHRLPPLEWHSRLTEIAAEHSRSESVFAVDVRRRSF